MKKPDRPEIVGQRLRTLREGIHLSQAKLAEKMGRLSRKKRTVRRNGEVAARRAQLGVQRHRPCRHWWASPW